MSGPMNDTTADHDAIRDLPALRKRLGQVCTRDFGRLLGQWRKLSRQRQAGGEALAKLQARVEASVARRAARAAAVPKVALDAALPISERADDILAAIRDHQVVVIAGETGSGKTTQLPKLCLAAGRGAAGLIGCTQPRRLAARSVARRVAEELGTQIGQQVGFQVRFTEQVSDDSLVKFMTDGILLAETQRDPWLSAYDTLIIDEAHERSLNIDFLLGYLKRLAQRRPDLKIIVTSATIDTKRFAEHFDDAPVIEVEGRAYPVEVRWRPLEALSGSAGGIQQGSAEHIARVLDELTAEDPRGDVLVFLPGEREIRDTHLLLSRRQYRHTEVLPLYARLSAKDQDRVFHPGPARRVVLATNVAETSLTVPRIRYVIDTGTARVKRYSQRSQLERLHVEPISRAAADQRKGRCGRVGPGVCVRLYDETDFDGRPRFTDPELLRSSLANVILRMLSLKLGEVEDFPFLETPEPSAIADGYRRLAELSAIDDARALTPIGRELARLPIDVQLARMLIEAKQRDALDALLTVVAFLSVQDPRERPADARGQADAAHKVFADPKSDFVGVLNLWRAYATAHEELTQSKLRDWCQKHFLSYLRMREWRELHRQLKLAMGELARDAVQSDAPPRQRRGKASAPAEKTVSERTVKNARAASRQDDAETLPADAYEAIHRCLLAGLPTQVAHKDEKGVFRGTRQRSFKVFPGSALAKSPPNWLFAAQILDVGGRVWGMLCARVDPRWIEEQAAHLIRRSHSDPHWSRKRGKVVAYEQVTLFGLSLAERRTVTFEQQDPALARAIFLQQALATGDIDTRVDFVRANQRVLEQAHELEAKQRREGLLKSPQDLAAFFEDKLPADIASRSALEKWYRKAAPAKQAALRWTLDDILDVSPELDAHAFPARLEIDGQRYRLEYRFVPGDEADGVTLHLPLAMLNALPATRCQWLVPGLLADKAAALIRSLPKGLRRNFVPAPDFARAFCEAVSAADEPLHAALARFLQRATGVEIEAAAFAGAELPAHFAMRFRLHDEHGRTLATSRSLDALRADWSGDARAAFSRQADADLTREDVVSWDFDDLPERVRSEGGLDAWPALVDQGASVALRVFERADEARAEHLRGVERLLRLSLGPALKQARRKLPIGNAVGLKYAPLGSIDGLREDLVEGGLADLLQARDLDLRTRSDFDRVQDELARGVFAAAVERLTCAEPIIEAQAELKSWLEPPLMGFAAASYDDLGEQLDALLQPGFLRDLPLDRLRQFPRYLQAMRLRAERLRQDPKKDQQRLLQVLPYWRVWLQRRAEGGEDLDELRWMIEEFRVSLFAQELGTAVTVSPKRMARALHKVERGGDA
ncbi:ATP-dependent RNA helicase HrpA [Oleiagrimonas soli]|nr:ATP-dependent RNA helicase HrpA [Oleiagrimonas soli]